LITIPLSKYCANVPLRADPNLVTGCDPGTKNVIATVRLGEIVSHFDKMLRFHRILIVYAMAIPLAVILGYFAATPNNASILMVGLLLFVLALPFLLRWNRWLLIFFWNSAFVMGFMPGDMPFWAVAAGLTFAIATIDHIMGHRNFLRAPELTKPILFLLAVVIFTAKFRGGLGMRMMGSASIGGKHYMAILFAITGYFALTSEPIVPLRRVQAVKLFFLPGLTHALSNLALSLGPLFYVLYLIVPVGSAITQAAGETGELAERYGGLGPAGGALLCYGLARWGIRGAFNSAKPWRLLILVAGVGMGLYSGFRSQFGLLLLLLAMQFMVEGLWKTRLLPFFLAAGAFCLMIMLLFANRMPQTIQRTLAFLPVQINPDVREQAETSSEWRFEMWDTILPMVPQYLLIGKGYGIDPTDLFLSNEAGRMGFLPTYAVTIVAGDYHSGPLSLLVPFGAMGALAFLWMLGAGIKVLCCNRRYGDPQLRTVNDLLLSFFLAEALSYFFIFGSFDTQLFLFLGTLGFSVSINGGVRRKESAKPVAANPGSRLLAPA
jgi:hypothetical protein